MNLIYCPMCDHLLQIDHIAPALDQTGGLQTCTCGMSWSKQLSDGHAFYYGRAVAVVIDKQQLKSFSNPIAPRFTYGSVYYPKPDDEFFTRVDDEKE